MIRNRLVLLGILLVLVGCSTSVETKECTGDDNGADVSVKLEFQGDKVLTQKVESTTDFTETIAGDEETEASYREVIESYSENFNAMEGLTHAFTFVDGVLTEKVEMDFRKVNFEELVASGLYGSAEVDETPTYVSLETVLAEFESIGLVCK